MTEKYHETDPMSDVISDDYRMLQMISRFGIKLGFGDQTVAATCARAGVDVTTFLTVVNYLKDSAHAHLGEMAERINLPALMKYLKNSHAYFIDFRLPAIRRKLIEAIDCSAPNQIAFLILKFYDEYASEVQRHMEYENTHIHTYVEQLLEGKVPGRHASYSELAHQHHDNHSSLSKSSHELKSIIIKYYPSDSDTQRLYDALMDIYIMEEDLFSHCHLEDTLFAEAVRSLENEVRCKVRQGDGASADGQAAGRSDATDTSGELSDREKEVICHVVRGLSNKEIAEKMFISANTVMTHRRNIARKTQIHSPAGLTIFAIVNGLINLDEVKL